MRMRPAAFAVVLFSLAAPVAAQTAYTAPCPGGSTAAVWRFYTGSDAEVYDFEVRSNHPATDVSLSVNQYSGRWYTRLSSSTGEDAVHGSTWLRPREWTDVHVRCFGSSRGEVTLNVTRRVEVPLRRGSGSGFGAAVPGPHTVPCGRGTYGSATWRFRTPGDGNGDYHYDFEVYVENVRTGPYTSDTLSWLTLHRVSPNGSRGDARLLRNIDASNSGRLFASASLSIQAGQVSELFAACINGSGAEDELDLRVTRREQVSLRRHR